MEVSNLLEVALAAIVVFLAFSLLVSGATELIAWVAQLRARRLWDAIRQMVDDSKTDGDPRPNANKSGTARTDKLYGNPLISAIDRKGMGGRTLISHLPPNAFAVATLRALVDGEVDVAKIKTAAASLPNVPLKDAVLTLVDQAGSTVTSVRDGLETWFDQQMTRVSQLYKRMARWIALGLGLLVAVLFNVDAIFVVQQLNRDEVLRAALVAEGQRIVDACQADDKKNDENCVTDEARKVADSYKLPVGWDEPHGEKGVDAWQVLGIVLAALALMQGAPFWYGLLTRAVGYRRARNGDG